MSPQDEPIVYRDLRRSINALRTKNYADKSFIPNDDFDAAFTKPVLEHYAGHLLGDVGAGRSHLAELYQNYRKTIAILVLMDYENSFVNFWALKDYSDESLPIGQERLAEIDPDLSPCPLWVQFNELQHLFLAPPFRLEPEPMDWSEQFVLPFLEKKYKGRGNFSTVYRIKIHPAYDQLGYDYCGEQEPHSYALKQLKSTEETGKVRKDSIIEWQNEVRANVVVRKQEHQNIIPLLHSHIYGPHCNLIFPLATYNLKEFYLNQKHPQPGEPRLRFIEKITRLVPALGTIHHGGDDSDAPSHGTKVGYHRDIKPDNILVFGKSQRFMISDLGLMKFHEIKGDKPDYTGEVSSTGISAYAAPECGVQGKKVGRAADIWSMGCILAEAITWCVCGHLGKVEFDRKRMTRDEIDGYEENRFFKRTRSSSTTLLKLEVVAWFNEIRERSDGDPLISECLELVQSIFKDGSRSRPTAEKIDCTFYEILNKHAKRLGVALLIEQPNYCNLVQPDTVRQTLPLSYSRSASRITLKRRRTENEFSPPSLYKGYSSLSPLPPLKKMRDISPYVHLKRLDTMFLIDDYVNDSETPWLKLESTLEKLASIATVYDQDGVDLAFINSPNYYSCLNTAGDVMKAFRRTGPAHECTYTLKRRLEETLSAYVQRFKDDKFTKPLNLIIITSGDFVAHDQFEETVMDWAKELDRLLAPKSQLGLQFVLVGCKADNVKRFKLLDDKMFEDYGVRDMVDATCYDPDGPENANLLENIMCGGMISALKIDRMQGLEEEDIDTLMED